MQKHWIVCAAWLVPSVVAADGALSCRWQPGSTAIAYGASATKDALPTDVRALVQGAPLAAADGAPPSFEALTPTHPARLTEPLLCGGDEPESADGMIELTFSRRVRLGIEYTLGKCQLFYHCSAAAAAGAATAPQLYLGFVGGGAPAGRTLPSRRAD